MTMNMCSCAYLLSFIALHTDQRYGFAAGAGIGDLSKGINLRKVALVLGSEGEGLTPAALEHCTLV